VLFAVPEKSSAPSHRLSPLFRLGVSACSRPPFSKLKLYWYLVGCPPPLFFSFSSCRFSSNSMAFWPRTADFEFGRTAWATIRIACARAVIASHVCSPSPLCCDKDRTSQLKARTVCSLRWPFYPPHQNYSFVAGWKVAISFPPRPQGRPL